MLFPFASARIVTSAVSDPMACGSYPATSAFVPLTTYDTFPLGTLPVFTLKASRAVLEQAILTGGVCVGSTATAGGRNVR